MRLSRALEEKEDVRKQWGGSMGVLHFAKVRGIGVVDEQERLGCRPYTSEWRGLPTDPRPGVSQAGTEEKFHLFFS